MMHTKLKLYICINTSITYYQNNFFRKRSDVHNCPTRNNNDYQQARNKRVFTDQAVRITGPILWNSLNPDLKNSYSINRFRKIFKNIY